FSKATYIHRAMNVGTTSFHNFTIELLKPPGGATLRTEPGREPVLENERVRVFRVALDTASQVRCTRTRFPFWRSHLLPPNWK
ncbi:MAG TPA: hypothetical protein VHQ95_07915, partial [Pyrinomonadaceae bacterium]|nr:hypothetical protein [Pyrinomonadaceae bacterium]